MTQINTKRKFLDWLILQMREDPNKVEVPDHVSHTWDSIMLQNGETGNFPFSKLFWAYYFEEVQQAHPTIVTMSRSQITFVNFVLAYGASGLDTGVADKIGLALESLHIGKNFKIKPSEKSVRYRSKKKATRQWGLKISVGYSERFEALTIF